MDSCCTLCRGPHGVCLTRGKCEHHITERRRDNADDRARQTYRNPTQDKALDNVMASRGKR